MPLVIHLWNRRKYREVPWAAIEYLLAALRKNARRIQIEQWLLLAIRTLIIVLVVLAVAEPFLEGARLDFVHRPAHAQGAGHRRLVLDGLRADRQKPLRAGQDWPPQRSSKKAGRATPSRWSCWPIRRSSSSARRPSSRAIFWQEIDNLRLAQGLADLPATLAQVEEVLAARPAVPPRRAARSTF